MRFLKLFESFTTDDYYQEQMDEEFSEIPIISMSDKYVSAISNIVDKYKSSRNVNNLEVKVGAAGAYINPLDLPDTKKYIRIKNPLQLNTPVYDVNSSRNIWTSLNITESEDEWFRVSIWYRIGYKRYKCDQIEGVERLLKDKGILK